MPKKFSWSFWKSKRKSKFQGGDANTDLPTNENQKQNESGLLSFRQSKRSSQDSLNVKDVSSLQPQYKFKSYPVSPRKSNQHETGYLSDQNPNRISYSNQNKNYSSVLFNDTAPQTMNTRPRLTLGSSEPFPFDVPRDPVPRQSLFYEFRYGDKSIDVGANSKDIAEKPIEDNYANPISNAFQSNLYRQSTTSEYNENTGRKSIVRIRPLSTVSRAPRQSIRAMPHRVGESLPTASSSKYVHQVPLKPNLQQAPILMTSDGKILQPVKEDKLRNNSLRLESEAPTISVSVVPQVKEEYVAFEEPGFAPMRKSLRKSLVRQSLVERYPQARRSRGSSFRSERNITPLTVYGGDDESIGYVQVVPSKKSDRMSSVQQPTQKEEIQSDEENKTIVENNEQENPFGCIQNQPVVYAVPTVPTRGTRQSVFQQSIKSLTSKNQKEEPVAYRKNIRYSMDTDYISNNPRRRSVAPSTPGFVNMEKGQPMLVSEFLNPITSLFISDLKDPVPKDPLTKPKEANVWVKPRPSTKQRSSFSRQPTKATPLQIYQTPPQSKPQGAQKKMSNKSNYKEESSSSEESIVVYRRKSKQYAPRRSYHRTAVYNAEIPSPVLPSHEANQGNMVNQQKIPADTPTSSPSNHTCGLKFRSSEKSFLKQEESSKPQYKVKMVSSAQQTDIEDELDLICYPSECVLKNSVLPSESGSRLRWRIIIKRGDEK